MNPSILIVDDEPMARTLLRLMLVRASYDVIEAIDGQDALEKIQQTNPDLMILDVMMPGIDGYAVCAEVRSNPETAEMPVIMLSAKTDNHSVERGMEVGATKYLTKPVSPEELKQQIKEILQTA